MPQQDHLTARLVVDDDFEVAPVNNRLFGSFVEHLGRCVYTGIYEPDHPTADEHGFRKDVIDLVKELGATTIRYPGGNFVSGYRWEDGIGPKQERPRRLDLAWHSTETNEFGLHEMAEWLEATGGNELMEAVNLGTRGLQEALDLLEYANVPGGTELSERRRANGRRQAVRYPHVVPGQRDGRPVAARPQVRRGLRHARRLRGRRHAPDRSGRGTGGVRLLRHGMPDLRQVGADRS